MKTRSFKVDKLFRDKIPNRLRLHDIVVHERTVVDNEYIQLLKNKLQEESQEVCDAVPQELCEELGDVLEVVRALACASGFTIQQIEEKRLAKREKSGGFDSGSYVSHITLPEDHPAIAYYEARIDRYPEIKKE